MREPIEAICSECGGIAILVTYDHQRRVKEGRRVYCSKECSSTYRSRISSETMAKTNRKYASERMTLRNPMRRPEIREKVSAALRAVNHGPPVRGGNGKPATEAEIKLVEILGPIGFREQCVVPTRIPRGSGYPTSYKIDCGNEMIKFGVEADGYSHRSLSRQAQDQKKDAFLESIGWKVLRFTNEEILSNPTGVFNTVVAAIMKD